MGKLQEFDITLNNDKTTYTPGESITGTLKVSLAQSIQCKAIKVNCQGICGVTSKAQDTDWMEEEQYFSSSVSIADKGTLKEGEHSFPFKFLLPATAPTSFEGQYGKIMYRVRAFIDTPRFAKDYKVEKSFTMSSNINLNDVPNIYEPSSSSVTKNFSYMLVKNGTVVLKAMSDLRGYIAGQIIKVSAEIENRSDKSTGHVVASLMQKITYNTKKPTIDLRAVAEVEGPGVKGGHKGEWKEQMIVPTLPLSTLTQNLIEINYYIQVYLKYPDVSLTLPIYIGNVAVDPSCVYPSRPVPPTPVPRSGSTFLPATSPASSATSPGSSATPPGSSATSSASLATSPASSTTDSAPPSLPPRTHPKPKPRPRSSYVPPSAPPAELYPQLPIAADYNVEIPRSPESGHQMAVSPNAFSYAPGLSFRQGQNSNSSSHNRERTRALSASSPLIQPPDYKTSPYPHEPPPSYEDSLST